MSTTTTRYGIRTKKCNSDKEKPFGELGMCIHVGEQHIRGLTQIWLPMRVGELSTPQFMSLGGVPCSDNSTRGACVAFLCPYTICNFGG